MHSGSAGGRVFGIMWPHVATELVFFGILLAWRLGGLLWILSTRWLLGSPGAPPPGDGGGASCWFRHAVRAVEVAFYHYGPRRVLSSCFS